MSRDRTKDLSFEDRILWARVARSTHPLPGKRIDADWADKIEVDGDHGNKPVEEHIATGIKAISSPARPAQIEGSRKMDAPLRQKLQKGRMAIDGRIDLHGLTQGEAYGLLLSFLHRAHAEGRRNLLVVTGKGRSPGSQGALRRAVPVWLSTPAFRGLVHSHADAARHHGGSGALYVRLRR